METVVILGLVAVVILILGYPLVNPQQVPAHAIATSDNDLFGEREIVFETLRDLQFEYATGKLSAQDYEQLKARYELQAAQILREIDARQAVKQGNSPVAVTCPRCHSQMRAKYKFCTKCGAKL
ncbi:MAG: zinc-ribbon domain-containing protein [Anaerolineae bacterium]|nr:zinc-ribbon domain-containing protein [Anaerolineae bacterium]